MQTPVSTPYHPTELRNYQGNWYVDIKGAATPRIVQSHRNLASAKHLMQDPNVHFPGPSIQPNSYRIDSVRRNMTSSLMSPWFLLISASSLVHITAFSSASMVPLANFLL
jgi:hypothetical protein